MIVFLDFDGVLHPNEVVLYQKRGIVLECDGHSLFEHADTLVEILSPYPQAKIVLSTSWVVALGFDRAKSYLPPDLQKHVIGATWHSGLRDKNWWWSLTRHQQIMRYVSRHRPDQWVAIDDNAEGWPDNQRHHLVHTDEWGGIGQKMAQNDLMEKLALMCASR